jgi:hypothetical protein
MAMGMKGVGTKNSCAGEGHKHFIDAVKSSNYTAMSGKIISEWRVGKDKD